MRVTYLLAAAALVGLGACGDGPNADSDDVPTAVNAQEETPLSSNDLGNTYPSQTGTQTTTTPGAEGGRGAATTGASPEGQGGDPNAQQQQQQTTPP